MRDPARPDISATGATVLELFDMSATTAIVHATELRRQLSSLEDDRVPGIGAAKEELHRLVADIATLRNAAELLRREFDRTA